MKNYIKTANEIPITQILDHLGIKYGKDGKLDFCPLCQKETDHASFPIKGNFVKCWANDENLNIVKIYSLMKHITFEDSAKEICDTFDLMHDPVKRTISKESKLENYWYYTQREGLFKAIQYMKEGFPESQIQGRYLDDCIIEKCKNENILGYNPKFRKFEGGEENEVIAFKIHDFERNLIGIWQRSFESKIFDFVSGSKYFGYFFYINKFELLHAAEIWITESIFDALTLNQVFMKQAFQENNKQRKVAIATCSAGNNNIDLSMLYGRRFILAFDNDDAGKQASYQLYHELIRNRQETNIFDLDSNEKDFNDLLRVNLGDDSKILNALEYSQDPGKSGIRQFPITVKLNSHHNYVEINHNHKMKFRQYSGKVSTKKVKTQKNSESGDLEETIEYEDLCSFAVHGIYNIETYNYEGKRLDNENELKFVVFVRAQEKASKKYPLFEVVFEQSEIKSRSINIADNWKTRFGNIYNTKLFAQYLEVVRSGNTGEVFKIVKSVGLVKDPNSESKYIVNSGSNTGFSKKTESHYFNYNFHKFDGNPKIATRQIIDYFQCAFKESVGISIFYSMFLSFFRAKVKNCPHVFVIAHPGSGKTALIELISNLLGNITITNAKQISTQYRCNYTFGNHTMPVIIDEISRIPLKYQDNFKQNLVQWYSPDYASSGNPPQLWDILGTAICLGQDGLNDNSLTTKSLKFSLRDRKVSEFNPKRIGKKDESGNYIINPLQNFPLLEFLNYLCDAFELTGKGSFDDLFNKAKNYVEFNLKGNNQSDLDRFTYNWALLLTCRELMLRFCEDDNTPQNLREQFPHDSDEAEDIIQLMYEQLDDIAEESRESIEILKDYSAAVNRDPSKYVVVIEDDYIYINAHDVILYMKQNQHILGSKGITSPKSLVNALKHDGLIESKKEVRKTINNSRPRFHQISRDKLEEFNVFFNEPVTDSTNHNTSFSNQFVKNIQN